VSTGESEVVSGIGMRDEVHQSHPGATDAHLGAIEAHPGGDEIHPKNVETHLKGTVSRD
jgi:hypothetical protein